MPSKSGPIRPKARRVGKKAGMTLEEILKIEKIRSSAPLQIMDGLKAQRGRPKRNWPNPVTRLNRYEEVVPIVVKPQTTAEPLDKPQPKRKATYPPLMIVMEEHPGSKKPKRHVSWDHYDPIFDEEPKKTKVERGTETRPHPSSTRTGHNSELPQHISISHGYSYDDLRQASKSPSESLSSVSYPSTPLSTHSYHAASGLISPPTFYHSPSELNNSMVIPSISLPPPPVTSSTPTTWQTLPTLPTLHELDCGGYDTPSWTWPSQHVYTQTYPPGYLPY